MTPTMLDRLAQVYADEALFASLHSEDPLDTGINELDGVARQALTWSPGIVDGVPVAGLIVSSAVGWTLAADTYLTHVGIWSAATGGLFLDSIPNQVVYDEAGEYVATLKYLQE